MPLRRLLAALLSLMLWSQTARALPYGSGANDPSIVIGVLATLTGPGAIPSQDMVDGLALGLKQLAGRLSNQEVRLVVLDDKGSPDFARQQMTRLVERERLDVVVTALSVPSLLAIMPQVRDSRLFVLNLHQVPANLAGAECSPYMFNLAAPEEGVHEAMGQYLTSQGVHRLVVVAPDSTLAGNALTALKHGFTGEVVRVLTPKHGAATFGRELSRIAALKPDAVYSLLTGGMGGALVRDWAAWPQKDKIPLFPVWQMVERPLLPALGDAATGLVGIGTWTPDLDSIPNRRFVTDFESEYGRPASTWAAEGYDTVFLLDAALKATNGKTNDADALRAALRKAEFVSVRGSFRFSTNHQPVLNYYLRKVVADAKGHPTLENEAVVLKDWRDRQSAACPMRWAE